MKASLEPRPKGSHPDRLWHYAAPVALCAKDRPIFHGLPAGPGVYVLEFGDESYVGQAGNLPRRLLEYRNTTDSVQERYIRQLIMDAKGGRVFCITGDDLKDKSRRQALEREVIAELRDSERALINKTDKPTKRYLVFKVGQLKMMLAAAEAALANNP